MNALTRVEPAHVPATNPMIPQTLDQAVRLAKIMSDMSLVPQHLQGKPADCMLIVEVAHRWRMSPFAVAQATSVLQGKLNFEGKLVAAALQTSGVLSSRLRYDYRGEGDGREVLVSAIVQGETEPREVLVRLREVKTGNRMWTSQPDQQLSYAGARIWGRRHAPEVMLGVYAPEEFEPAGSAALQGAPRAEPPHKGPTLDAKAEPCTSGPDLIPDLDDAPSAPPPPPDGARTWATALCAKLATLTDSQRLMALVDRERENRDNARQHRPELSAEVEAAFSAAYSRLMAPLPGDETPATSGRDDLDDEIPF